MTLFICPMFFMIMWNYKPIFLALIIEGITIFHFVIIIIQCMNIGFNILLKSFIHPTTILPIQYCVWIFFFKMLDIVFNNFWYILRFILITIIVLLIFDFFHFCSININQFFSHTHTISKKIVWTFI